MELMTNTLPFADWLDEQASLEPEAEHAETVQGIKARRDMGKQNEAQMQDVLSSLKFKMSELEAQERDEDEQSEAKAAEIETAMAGCGPDDGHEVARQITLDTNLVPQTVAGNGPGHYYDLSPYHCWNRWYTHREGGTVEGRVSCNRSARLMHSYSYARGSGAGFWNDNYTTSWTKLYFAFWPRQNGHVRAYVPYRTRGFYDIYANDKWYNEKSATIDVDVSVKLHQNYWGGHVKDDVFRRYAGNINQQGRVDVSRSLYSGGIPVGANKWVVAEVAVRNYVHAQGSGSRAKMSFWNQDHVFVPYVRFDFS